MWILIAIAIVLFGTFMFVVLPVLVHKTIGPALQARVSQVYKPEHIQLQDLRALSFGLESLGKTQARGNGALVLTGNELHFFQLTPEREFHIPLAAITEVEAVRSHLGKSIGKEILRVAFTVDGKADSLGVYVTDLATWLAKLEAARKPRGAPAEAPGSGS